MESPDPLIIHIVYLSYGFRALSLLAGVVFVVLGARMIDRHSRTEGRIEGGWKSLKVTMSNAPVGTFLTVLGTGVVLASLLVGGPEYSAENPGQASVAFRAPAGDTATSTTTGVRIFSEAQLDSIVAMGTGAQSVTRTSVITGTLGDDRIGGRYVDVFRLRLSTEANVTIHMESEDVDPFLVVTDTEQELGLEDDDSGEGWNARLGFQAQADRDYMIVATSYRLDDMGGFVVRINVD